MNHFIIDNDRAIAGVIAVPENNQVRIYVAWDWTPQVRDNNIVSFYKSSKLFQSISKENILETCRYGQELTQKEALKYFKSIISTKLIKSNNSVGVW